MNGWFHDNFAFNNTTGFLTDSGTNTGVVVEFNQITNPTGFGMVVGGGNVYNNYRIQYNNINLSGNQAGIIFNGNVASATVINNNITAGGSSSSAKGIAFGNSGNTGSDFEFNQIWNTFGNNPVPAGNCVFNNWDQAGNPLSNFPNTQSTQCPPPTPR